MRIFVAIAGAVLAGCSANPQKEVARKAAIAMTGSPETLTAVVSLTLEGTGSLDGAPVAAFTRAMSFRKERLREEITRAGLAPSVTGLDGKLAYRFDVEGRRLNDSEADAADRRSRLYHHPIGFLLAAFSANPKLGNTRLEGAEEAVDLTVPSGTYSLFIDSQTGLPARVVSREGDSIRETSFSQYQKVHGYTLPYRIVEKKDGQTVAEWNIARQFAGWDIPLAAPKS